MRTWRRRLHKWDDKVSKADQEEEEPEPSQSCDDSNPSKTPPPDEDPTTTGATLDSQTRQDLSTPSTPTRKNTPGSPATAISTLMEPLVAERSCGAIAPVSYLSAPDVGDDAVEEGAVVSDVAGGELGVGEGEGEYVERWQGQDDGDGESDSDDPMKKGAHPVSVCCGETVACFAGDEGCSTIICV